MNILEQFVDASYEKHAETKSHTKNMMTMGKGSIILKSTKQKLNTKSITELELVGADDTIPDILWTRNF